MRKPVFTIDAFRPSAEEYCRGCRTDGHGEDHELTTFDDPQEAARSWIQLIARNSEMEHWEGRWQMTLMINGVPCSWVEGDGYTSGAFSEEDLTPAEQVLLGEFEADTKRVSFEMEAAKKEAAEKAARELAERKLREKEEAEVKAREARRRAYEALKQEFGS